MKDHKSLLEELFVFAHPGKLKQLLWDIANNDSGADDVANLTPAHIISVLQRYIAGRLSAKKVESWAEALELRKDVVFGYGDDPVTIDVILDLGTPYLIGGLTPEKAREMIGKLQAVTPEQARTMLEALNNEE